ncbi:MAG: EFR1 family ferrodoxin [Treponema sp.]|jgi:ferredoxin/flavodoxin|nr:EFR1 family ferrodoxin [Treponema sp.]
MDNIIFYFTGTGNSLKVAKTISKELDNAEIVSMNKLEKCNLSKQYGTIGFVYPVYYWGMPNIVRNFVEKLDLTNNRETYFYGVATFGGLAGNGISQLNDLLINRHNIKLNYGQKIKMFANYIVAYNMSGKVKEITNKSDKKIVPVINAIKNKKDKRVKSKKIFDKIYNKYIDKLKSMDKDYIVSDNCTGCKICKNICPAKNIEIINGIPHFGHNCEQCVACIQYCPQKAINYKNLTQNRTRYTNPEISCKELMERNK